jgi:hypothetical protein
MFIKINPQRKEFTTILVLALGVGNVVAWGHHLHVQLRHQNCKFAVPVEKNLLPGTQKLTMMMKNLPLSSAEVTSCNE